jgi:zinc D-Ala-D-Ala carboxypeptidase
MEYKVLIVKNRYTKKIDFSKGINWFPTKTPLKVTIEEISTDFDLQFRNAKNKTYAGVVADKYQDNLRKVVPEGKYNCVCLVYGNKAPDIRASITENVPLYPDTDLIQVVKLTDKGIMFNHELFHAFIKKVNRQGIMVNDPMDTYLNDKDLNASPSNRSMAIDNLKNYWSLVVKIGNVPPKKNDSTYKFFKPEEIVGLQPELVQMLDRAREIASVPFKITSGYRDPQHNKAVGGVANSSHTKGLAVDLACTDNFKRTRILLGLLTCGTPNFIEICKSHIHVDISSSNHPLGQTMWANDD